MDWSVVKFVGFTRQLKRCLAMVAPRADVGINMVLIVVQPLTPERVSLSLQIGDDGGDILFIGAQCV